MAALTAWAPPVLMAAVLLLYPFDRFAEVPMAIMALGGLWICVRHWRALWRLPASDWLALAFLGYWVPITLSAADSVAPWDSWRVAASTLRYFFVGVFALWALRESSQWRRLGVVCVVLLGFWVLDALAQAAFGQNLLGMPRPERLNGVFGVDHLKLGPTLAVLLPLLALRLPTVPGWVPVSLLTLAALVILLTGTRAAWIMLALYALISLWRYRRQRGAYLVALAVLLALSAVLTTLYRTHDGFQARVDRTLSLLDGDAAGVDAALSSRLTIWRTSTDMFLAHPINGVGVRAFQEHYAYHAQPADPWVNRRGEGGALYAHHYWLEVISETGIFGLLGLLLMLLVLIHAWSASDARARRLARPFALALVLVLFPLNTHYAFYSTFWSILIWWLIIAYLAALNTGLGAARLNEAT